MDDIGVEGECFRLVVPEAVTRLGGSLAAVVKGAGGTIYAEGPRHIPNTIQPATIRIADNAFVQTIFESYCRQIVPTSFLIPLVFNIGRLSDSS